MAAVPPAILAAKSVPFIVKALPYAPALIKAIGGLFGFGGKRKEAGQQRQQGERDWAIRKALADYYLDRRGLRSRLPPALLAALMQPPNFSRPGTGWGGGIASSLFDATQYLPQVQNLFKGED